jgi:hypothetical protein
MKMLLLAATALAAVVLTAPAHAASFVATCHLQHGAAVADGPCDFTSRAHGDFNVNTIGPVGTRFFAEVRDVANSAAQGFWGRKGEPVGALYKNGACWESMDGSIRVCAWKAGDAAVLPPALASMQVAQAAPAPVGEAPAPVPAPALEPAPVAPVALPAPAPVAMPAPAHPLNPLDDIRAGAAYAAQGQTPVAIPPLATPNF